MYNIFLKVQKSLKINSLPVIREKFPKKNYPKAHGNFYDPIQDKSLEWQVIGMKVTNLFGTPTSYLGVLSSSPHSSTSSLTSWHLPPWETAEMMAQVDLGCIPAFDLRPDPALNSCGRVESKPMDIRPLIFSAFQIN